MSKVEDKVVAATENQIRAEKLLEALWNDGKLGPELQAKAGEMFPEIKDRLPVSAAKPIIDQVDAKIEPLTKRLTEALERIEAKEKADGDRLAQENLEQAVSKAVADYSLTEDGRLKMLERMKEQKSFDAEAAAAWVASKAPPKIVDTPTWQDKALNLFAPDGKDEKLALLHKNPTQFETNEINEFLRDPEKYVQETFA